MRTIDPSIKSSISYFKDARLLWDDLAESFATVDGSKIHALKEDLHNCKQEKGMTVTSYFGALKVLWDALANHEPISACTCGHCTCGITKNALARQDSERLHKFLMGLDRSIYGNLRSQLLSLDTLPTLNRAFQLTIQEERLKVGDPSVLAEPRMFFALRRRPATSGPSNNPPDWRALRALEKQERRKLKCSHCTGPGHEASSCFIRTQKFPDWWGDRPRTLEEVAARARSTTCAFASRRFRVNAARPSSSSDDRLSGMCSDWIIDTGASRHVTGNISWLTNSRPILACPITLPNGHTVSANVAGTVWFSEFIFLTDVLFVPNLTCNLLSVSQLIAATNCVFSFTNHSCHIQDPSLRTRIGAGELRDGLYFLRVMGQPTAIHAVSAAASFDLWHKRLGHPSNKVVHLLPQVSKSSTVIDTPCDICHQAK
ncbi:uncharacterized protein LOC141600841 [Silene latifolia]|uniref:uncharacterized protein LOC141600841 n=1 Tax=Silene latifolia TaxID=37657 RepID=UPI003D7746F5